MKLVYQILLAVFFYLSMSKSLLSQQFFRNSIHPEQLSMVEPNFLAKAILLDHKKTYLGVLSKSQYALSDAAQYGYDVGLVSWEKIFKKEREFWPYFGGNHEYTGFTYGATFMKNGSPLIKNTAYFARANLIKFIDGLDVGLIVGFNVGYERTRFDLEKVVFASNIFPVVPPSEVYSGFSINPGISYFIFLDRNQEKFFSVGASYRLVIGESIFSLSQDTGEINYEREDHVYAHINFLSKSSDFKYELFALFSYTPGVKVQIDLRKKIYLDSESKIWTTAGLSFPIQNLPYQSFVYLLEFGLQIGAGNNDSLFRNPVISVFAENGIANLRSPFGIDIGINLNFTLPYIRR